MLSEWLFSGESTITREMNRRHLTVKLNLRGRDLISFFSEAQAKIANEVPFDKTAYEVSSGGAFENQQRAQSRLAIILPGTLCIIFLLLYAGFGKVRMRPLSWPMFRWRSWAACWHCTFVR